MMMRTSATRPFGAPWFGSTLCLLALVGGCGNNPMSPDAGDVNSQGSDVNLNGAVDAMPDASLDGTVPDVVPDASLDSNVPDVMPDAPLDSSVSDLDAGRTDVALDAGPDSAELCGGDPRLGTACTVGNACEQAEYRCVSDVVTCVGTGVPRSAGTECRAASGLCDLAESCDGLALVCPADTFAAPEVTCRASAGECDTAEHCTGSTANCPADGFEPVGTACALGYCDSLGSCAAGCTPGVACDTGNPCERRRELHYGYTAVCAVGACSSGCRVPTLGWRL